VEQLGKICAVLKDMGALAAYPQIQLAKLSIKGLLIDPLSRQNHKFGHFEAVTPPLLPFPQLCASLEVGTDLAGLSERQLQGDWEEVTEMCRAVGVDPERSPALRCARNGQRNVAARLRAGDTRDLPPTASMPDARYNPGALYADPA